MFHDEHGTCLHMICENIIQRSTAQEKEDTPQDTPFQEYVLPAHADFSAGAVALRAAGLDRACLSVETSVKPVYSIAQCKFLLTSWVYLLCLYIKFKRGSNSKLFGRRQYEALQGNSDQDS
ncbi:MAG: hypothetical protein NTX06_01755 [Proteobacteria bacterium]|nr:hypothetical protein [Pseudomonadota bacterium]